MSERAKRAKELSEYRAEQRFHEREWTIQRFGWGVLILVLAAGMAGAFGGGPLAQQTVAIGESRVEMDRFIRYNSASEWRILPDPVVKTNSLPISLSAEFVEQYEIKTITPAPVRTSLSQAFVVFEFENSRPIGSIVFHVQPAHMGKHEGSVRIADSTPVAVYQFVYP